LCAGVVLSGLFLLLGIGVGIALVLAIAPVFHGRGPEQRATTGLIAGAPATELTSQKAERVRQAIERGDYQAAQRISAGVLSKSRLENWRYYPFSDFIYDIANVNDAALEAPLTRWTEQAGGDAIPWLVRSRYYYGMAWFKRGHNSSNETRTADLAAFQA
jgi:hypothetical protein